MIVIFYDNKMSDNNYTLSRALRHKYFIDYLTKNINGNVDWEDVSNKCINKDNEYCLAMIKSKAWIDKSEKYVSYAELFDENLKKQIKFNANTAALISRFLGSNIYIININKDNTNLSDFFIEISNKMNNIFVNTLKLYGVKYEYVDNNIPQKEFTSGIVVDIHNIVTYNDNNHIYNEITGIVRDFHYYFVYNVIPTEAALKQLNLTKNNVNDILNSSIMIWEYLIYNTYTYPNVFYNNVKENSKQYVV